MGERMRGIPDLANRLNLGCACQFLDRQRLCAELSREPALADICASLIQTHPHLFSASSVFVSAAQVARMAAVVEAVEAISVLPQWQQVFADAPPIARHDGGVRGGLLGFDFHLDADKASLIEINTNPGGALLNIVLARAQRACCAQIEPLLVGASRVEDTERAILDIFLDEWREAGRSERPARIAIVDSAPASQYLYPEFLLYRRLFEDAGIDTLIADPGELARREGRLWHATGPVDFVYNRLTDFMLEAPEHAGLREAWAAGAVVLSPHPHAHVRYANKLNLTLLSDAAFVDALPLAGALREALRASVPRTERVTAEQAEAMWAARRQLFFKPAEGFGSRAAYRGDKLTRRVWQEILAGQYVAQSLEHAGERLVPQDDAEASRLKFDVRTYAYAGRIVLLAARLYHGQTTNFRTPGGGFAPVWVLGEEALARAGDSFAILP